MHYKTNYLNKTDFGGDIPFAGGAPRAEREELGAREEYATLTAQTLQVIRLNDGNPDKALDFPRVGFISLSSDLAQSSRVPLEANEQTQFIACLPKCEADLAFCS